MRAGAGEALSSHDRTSASASLSDAQRTSWIVDAISKSMIPMISRIAAFESATSSIEDVEMRCPSSSQVQRQDVQDLRICLVRHVDLGRDAKSRFVVASYLRR
jgi:hypothetical protein